MKGIPVLQSCVDEEAVKQGEREVIKKHYAVGRGRAKGGSDVTYRRISRKGLDLRDPVSGPGRVISD